MVRAGAILGVALGLLACGGRLADPDADLAPDAAGDADVDVDADADADAEAEARRGGPTCVLVDDDAAARERAAGQDVFAGYVAELLAHAGLPFQRLGVSGLEPALARCPVVVVAHDAALAAPAREALERLVRDGGTLIALGGTSGLDELLGATSTGPRAEGYVELADGRDLGAFAPLPLHVFGGVGVTATAAEAQGWWLDAAGEPTGDAAVTRRSLEAGEAWLVGPDLAGSIVTIQQGRPIAADGAPAPDGTAAVDDGILKTDDGIVLDWTLDRGAVEGEPLFLEPVADLLRELLLRLVLRGHARLGTRGPLLWYWPGDLDAVGALSHDSDGNDAALARELLAEVSALGLETTWCFMQRPETLPPDLFAEVAAAGGEISLHYDARTAGTTWGEEGLLDQLAWLAGVSGAAVTTNKNHYLRWEGWVDFYRWLEAAGLEADQSKGPSKRGNVGFLYGTCHPFFPVDDAAHDNRVIDVLAVNLFTQDLALTCAAAVGPALADRAAARYGVAHFLFHPAHVEAPGVADAMRHVVDHGRSLGMEWWTIDRINRWERARRQVVITADAGGATISTPAPLAGATLLVVLDSAADRPELSVGGAPVTWTRFPVYGVDAARFTVDLPAGDTALTVEPGP